MGKVSTTWPKSGRPYHEFQDSTGTRQRIPTGVRPDARDAKSTVALMEHIVQAIIDKVKTAHYDALMSRRWSMQQMLEAWLAAPKRKGRKAGEWLQPGDDERLAYIEDLLTPTTDLRDLIAAYAREGANPDHITMLVRFCDDEFCAGQPAPIQSYTRARLVSHLRNLTWRGGADNVAVRTRERYRTAHSLFQEHLLEADVPVIDHNFAYALRKQTLRNKGAKGKQEVRDEKAAEDRPSIPMEQAVRYILWLPTATRYQREFRAMCALMTASAAEAGSCVSLHIKDCNEAMNEVDLHSLAGDRYWRRKNDWRSRPVELANTVLADVFFDWVREVEETPVTDPRAAGRVFPSFICYMTQKSIDALKAKDADLYKHYLTVNPHFERRCMKVNVQRIHRRSMKAYNNDGRAVGEAALPTTCVPHDFRRTFQVYWEAHEDARHSEHWRRLQMGHEPGSDVGTKVYGRESQAMRADAIAARRAAVQQEKAHAAGVKVLPLKQA